MLTYGGITRLRQFNASGLQIDALTYHYVPGKNLLTQIKDALGTSASPDDAPIDVPNQIADNYQYDAIGNQISDASKNLTSVSWTVFGKVRRAEKIDGSFAEYRYDGLNNKTLIKVTDEDGTTHLRHYVRDASGYVLAIYTDNALTEHHIYGSARIGIAKAGTEKYRQTLAHKHYELSNHLGNILSVISDKVNAAKFAQMGIFTQFSSSL